MLVDYAGIDKNTYIIGVGEYGEIWSEASYLLKTENENVEKMREELELLGL
jgi:DNA-binding transcriptional regulator/RsmH inhibitor MraZ